jgi:hypothetical protein
MTLLQTALHHHKVTQVQSAHLQTETTNFVTAAIKSFLINDVVE